MHLVDEQTAAASLIAAVIEPLLKTGEFTGSTLVADDSTTKSGKAGPQGPRGRPGEPGRPGPQGHPGRPGPEGPRGKAGPVGKPGPQGKRGEAGLQGKPGVKGEAGLRGEAGSRGETGARGDAGPRGEPGLPGALPSIEQVMPWLHLIFDAWEDHRLMREREALAVAESLVAEQAALAVLDAIEPGIDDEEYDQPHEKKKKKHKGNDKDKK